MNHHCCLSFSNLRNFIPLSSSPQNRIFFLCHCTPQTFENLSPSFFHSSQNRVFLSPFRPIYCALSFLCASDKMDVREKLIRSRFHLILAALGILILAALLYLAPSLLTLLSYFWPLLLSTALFLAAVFLFHRISPPESDASSHRKAGEQLLDYVAGQPEVISEIKDSEEEEEEDKDAMKSE